MNETNLSPTEVPVNPAPAGNVNQTAQPANNLQQPSAQVSTAAQTVPLNNVAQQAPVQENTVVQPQIKTVIPMAQAPSTLENTTEFQGIPTIEQSREEFITNTQNNTVIKKEEKKQGINYLFFIGLFIVIFVVIKFLFPILLRYI